MGGQDKQVAFEDPHSSASDEDAKAVEVTTNAPPCNALHCHCHHLCPRTSTCLAAAGPLTNAR